jgi:UDP-N-acetylmuramate dehydrogenase
LIEAVGLKGMQKGGMAWSTVHSNFLVNLGGGTYDEAKFLIDLAKEKVLREFGIAMQEEIKIL